MKTTFLCSVAAIRHNRVNRWLLCLVLLVSLALPAFSQEVVWDRTYGGSESDYLNVVQQTSDGGYILGGYSSSNSSGNKTENNRENCSPDPEDFCSYDYWIVKLDKNGTKVWDKTFGGNNNDFLYALQQTADGGYILGGTSWSGISGDKSQEGRGLNDYWIIKLDADGNKEWDKTFGGDEWDQLTSLRQTSSGGYILGGDSRSGKSADKSQDNRGIVGMDYDYWIIKLDHNGDKEWDKTFGGESNDLLTSLQQTNEGGYILGGYSNSGVSGEKTEANNGTCNQGICTENYWVVKIDDKGNKEWDKTIGGDRFDYLQSLQQTKDGGYILGGYAYSGKSGDKTEVSRGFADYWIVKLDASGNIEWDKSFGGDDDDYLKSLQQTRDDGYILGGSSFSEVSGDKSEAKRSYSSDYWVVKINANGNKEWDKTIGGGSSNADWDNLSSIHQTSDGGYILGGTSVSPISGDKSEESKGYHDYWIVKLSGKKTTCTPPTPSIAVIPTSKVYTGGDASTIYLGYGPQSVQLVASGGTTYSWSPATGLSSATAAAPVFTPTSAGTYTFTVTAYNSTCSKTASVTITVVDARCGNGKMMLCHKGKVICISPSAVAAHLRNYSEDRLGSCSSNSLTKGKSKEAKAVLYLTVYPNPLHNKANVELSLPKDGPYLLELHSANGKKVSVVGEGKARAGELVSLELKVEKLREGIYYLRLTTADEVKTLRLVLKK